MIRQLAIKNYKIHKNLRVDLGNLTILAGENSGGKSAILQVLLLLRQSYTQGVMFEGLLLQGELCNVGLIDDAICQYADENTIEISLKSEQKEYIWRYAQKDNNPRRDVLPFAFTNIHAGEVFEPSLHLFGKKFQYIGASRLGPQESYPLNTIAVEINNKVSSEFGKCDLVAHYLHYYGVEKGMQINEALRFEGLDTLDLLPQVSAWENEISRGVNVVVQPDGKAFTLKYSFSRQGEYVPGREYSATNVGYGLSYALPVVVALLTMPIDGVVIIENPEIHLHPQGQAALAKLIALTAQTGVQVLVETHSDHIINGILVATKKFEEAGIGIDRKKVKIYQCKKNDDTQLSEVHSVQIIGDGKIDSQPDGFFDQTDKDLQYLMGF